jgi:Xaa-Pro aminopeptidase
MNELAQTDVTAQLHRRRTAVADEWNLDEQVVLVGAGDPILIPGRGDLTYPFRAHSEYFYLTDRNLPGGVLAFDPQEGWRDFLAPISATERLWLGLPPGEPDDLTTDQLQDWLKARSHRVVACLGVPPDGVVFDAELTEELRLGLSRVRRPKDAVELERMRVAQRATAAGFAAAVPLLQEGRTERAAQVELEAEAFRAGADGMAYETIVASGPNSAALHFLPGMRAMQEGDLVLIDAGAEYLGYASDITRTYPVGGRLSSQQQELHSLVRSAEMTAIELCRPGVEWRDVHRAAALAIAEGLVELGILRGEPDSLVESGAAWLFFPHGIGHFVGLGVRDAGGRTADRRNDPAPYPNLRIDLQLDVGMVVTVEPGIYMVPALLEDPERRARHRDEVVWDRVDGMLDFGGIRIEDNVLITEEGHEVITRDVPLLG